MMTDSDFAIKCPHCIAVNPSLNSRVLQWSNGIVGVIFSCTKCHKIISIAPIPLADVQARSAILRPTSEDLKVI